MIPATARVGSLLLASGFCALVYQVTWLRLLRLVFGASTAATAAVLAIFMGGLGLGGILLGRRVERRRNPLAFYAGLEIAIALLAAVSPFLIDAARAAYLALGGSLTLGSVAGTAVRLLLATVILGLPTTLMGGTLPAAARAVEESRDRGRRATAWLYGLNTLGSVAGALVTTFVLLELVGIRQSLWLACALNLLVAMAARRMARWPAFAGGAPAAAAEVERVEPAAEAAAAAGAAEATAAREGADPLPRAPAVPTVLVLAAAAVVGFVFLVMELVWYRMLAPILGGSSYTFGLILAVALLGIGLGGMLYGLGARDRRPTAMALAATCALEAVLLAAPFAVGDDLALLAIVLRNLGHAGFWPLVMAWGLLTVLVVLPAAVIAGYQFPLLIALLGSGRRGVGRDVGVVYAWNTWGAILGSLAGGFLLLPGLGAPTVWRASTLALVALAALAVVVGGGRGRTPLRLAATAALAVVALSLAAARGPTAFWRHQPIGAGRIDADFGNPNAVRRAKELARYQVIWQREGLESSVAISVAAQSSFLINGKADGSARSDAPTQVMSGLIGCLLHADPRRSLVIGLGTGSTAGWLAQVATMEQVDVVELEPAMLEVARFFAPVNAEVMSRDNVTIHVGDGRELVLTTDQRYDIVFSEPSNPYRAGIASLFSRDFYQAAAGALEDDGFFLQWLQAYEVDAEVVQTAYTTLRSVFPHVETWSTQAADLLLVASKSPRVYDLSVIAARAAEEPYRSALWRTWDVDGVEGVFSGYLANDHLARVISGLDPLQVSTDDRPRIEFGFARNVGNHGSFSVREIIALAERLDATAPPTTGGALDQARLRELREVRVLNTTLVALPPLVVDDAWAIRRRARSRYLQGHSAEAAGLWQTQDGAPRTHFDRLLLAEGLAERGDPEAEAALLALPASSSETEVLRSLLRLRQERLVAATDAMVAALERFHHDPWPDLRVMDRAFRRLEGIARSDAVQGERLFDALETPFAARLLERQRLVIRIGLARAIDFQRLCRRAFAPFAEQPLWDQPLLEGRARCYQETGHPLAERAWDDLQTYLALAPARLGAALLLAPPEEPEPEDHGPDTEMAPAVKR